MMTRFFRLPTFVACAGLTLGLISTSRADFGTGTQGLADLGTPTINASTLSAATQFTFGAITTTSAETGSFLLPVSAGLTLGMPSATGIAPTSNSVMLDITKQTLTFGTADFGTFVASMVKPLDSSDAIRSFYVLGTFTTGTRFGAPATGVASFNISFTSNSSTSGTSYSDSGTLSVPVAPADVTVPEPASIVMLGLGLVGVAGTAARRRLAR